MDVSSMQHKISQRVSCIIFFLLSDIISARLKGFTIIAYFFSRSRDFATFFTKHKSPLKTNNGRDFSVVFVNALYDSGFPRRIYIQECIYKAVQCCVYSLFKYLSFLQSYYSLYRHNFEEKANLPYFLGKQHFCYYYYYHFSIQFDSLFSEHRRFYE